MTTAPLLNPYDARFYARYVDLCYRLGVEPNRPERVRELVGKWNAMLKGESDPADSPNA